MARCLAAIDSAVAGSAILFLAAVGPVTFAVVSGFFRRPDFIAIASTLKTSLLRQTCSMLQHLNTAD
jgi:hypothetical protein